MKSSKNLTLIFRHFEQEHFGKDVFLVPYYLGKQLGYEVTVVYPQTETNASFPSTVKDVRLVPLNSNHSLPDFLFGRAWRFYWYLLCHARQIDLLMRFHFTLHTELMIIIYKLLNVKGKSYVKLDLDYNDLSKSESIKRTSFRHKMGDWLAKAFIRCVDRVSCETFQSFELLQKTEQTRYKFGDKLVLMPNGFDGDTLQSYHIHENLFAEKENLMITVGRLGTPQKNTDMFLRALSQIDLKDWKVALIGPVEESFQPVIDSFFNDNPDKAKNVIFTGAIYEKQKLWEYYNRAKVFVLTSRWESYALVLNEAKRFRNYLLSTDVGAYRDLSENGKYGTSIPINDDKRLGEVLQDIIEGKINIDVYRNSNMDLLSWEKMVQLLKL